MISRRGFLGALGLAVLAPKTLIQPTPDLGFKKSTYELEDLYISPEAMEDIKRWNVDQVDEQTRKAIFADGK